MLGLPKASDRLAFENTRHLLPGRKRSKDALSRDRHRSGLGAGAERPSPAPAESLGGDQGPAEHVPRADGVDGDDLRRPDVKRAVSRREGGSIGAEGQDNRPGAPPPMFARGLLPFTARKLNRLALVDQDELN